MSQKKIIIVGYSGHAFVVCDILIRNEVLIKGYCDKMNRETNPYNLKYLGSENEYLFTDENVLVAIGDNKIRKSIFENLVNKVNFGNAYHPSAAIGFGVQIGTMTTLGALTIINPLTKIGKGVIINSCAIVEHECIIGDFVHIAPGAVIAGGVLVGDNTFIGARAVIKQGIKICEDVIIGAGTVVLKDITEPGTYVGIPALKILN
jgi:sugar O-acyltransferase (sialic acid O-acetyltransferase NeuD family)